MGNNFCHGPKEGDLLTEKSELVGTTHFLEWTREFSNQLAVEPGTQPTPQQVTLYYSQREYLLLLCANIHETLRSLKLV